MGAGVAHAGTSAEQLVFAPTDGIHGRAGVACKFGVQVPSNHRRGLPSVPGDLVAIGEVAQARHPGRSSAGDIILFHSLGLGIQDAAAAWAAYQGALEAGIGTTVAF
jgi:hypothetical protein